MKVPARVVLRTLTNVQPGPNGCIETRYSTGSHGYGQIGWQEGGQRFATLTHRVAWMAQNGPIPDGLTVDHLCRNRKCLNVAHLRLLTNSQNASDNGFATRTHCPRGHEYAGPNLYRTPSGDRRCRECAKGYRRSAKRRAA